MRTLLIRDAACIATFDPARPAQTRELRNASLYIRGNRIDAIGPADTLPATADEVIDARGHLVTPGLVNTHHHMYQSLTRAIPAVQDAELFSWLRGLYPLWAGLTPEMVRVSTQVAMAELLLSGCTTSSDHLYLYPNGVRLEDSIEAAQQIGMRFTATRGSMSVGQSQGGLPPDRVVEREDVILQDSQRLIEAHHDATHGAMLQIALAPCSPFSVSRDLMRESARLARSKGVRLHTHLAENDHDIAYSREKFNCTPAQYAQDLGWLGEDVWHAHCVKLDDEGISLFAATRTGVAHCPCSNMRLASGIAPVRRMLDAGVPVGLGSTAAPATMPRTWSTRHGRRCCWRVWAARWRPSAATAVRPTSARATRWRWPPAVVHRCWAARTSGTWRWACVPIWPCSTCGPWGLQVRQCTIRWEPWCFAAVRKRPGPWSTDAWWCVKGNLPPWISAR
jgi:8-oxoguanine deaminase